MLILIGVDIRSNNLGVSFNDLGKYEDAIIDYTKAIEIDPLFVGAYIKRGRYHLQYLLGDVLCDLGRNGDAIINYTKAIEIDPQHHMAYHNRGRYYFKYFLGAALSNLGRNERCYN